MSRPGRRRHYLSSLMKAEITRRMKVATIPARKNNRYAIAVPTPSDIARLGIKHALTPLHVLFRPASF